LVAGTHPTQVAIADFALKCSFLAITAERVFGTPTHTLSADAMLSAQAC
jgi:hypothetical protein